ncbi:polyprotein [Gossypium australe]|uniref:Polyprotein n=1 Tax=Gossypium australe TaxID=47621 RepID=A0A5B6WRI6_9ROSI|nr:polyprotein [Gossypium australe]
MLGFGFVQSKYDSSVYLQLKDPSEIERLKTMLNSKFEMKDLGTTKQILRIEISRDQHSGKLFLSQQRYIKRILE